MLMRCLLRCALWIGALAASFVHAADYNLDWTKYAIYFVMPDRFENGDPNNDRGGDQGDAKADWMRHGFNPVDKGFYHGGDLKGLTQRLDYLRELGINAIWLTPIFKNKPVQGRDSRDDVSAGYHGYWVTDFTEVDPHLGSKADLKALIAQAHAKGIKVFADIIVNHTADIINFKECPRGCEYRNTTSFPYTQLLGKRSTGINAGFDPKKLTSGNFSKLTDPRWAYTPYFDPGEEQAKTPAWLNDVMLYHNRGDSSFSGESSLLGDFYGLDDLYTANPRVVDGMIEIYKYWIREFKFDGFRIDTMKHVNIEFWQKFLPEIKKYAVSQGVDDFFMFGEVYENDPKTLSYYTKQGLAPAVLDFAFQAAVSAVFSAAEPTDVLRDFFVKDDLYNSGKSDTRVLPTFLGNHDMGRMGYFLKRGRPYAEPSELLARSRLAHAFMIFSRGIPVIYYGDEQGFTGDGGDKDAREDMFPSKVKSYNDNVLLGTSDTTAKSNFNTKHPLFLAIKEALTLRKQHLTLQRGIQVHRYSEGNAGVYAFSKILPEDRLEYLVVFNLSDQTRGASFYTSASGITYQKIFPEDSSGEVTSSGFRLVDIDVPPMDYVVYKAQQPLPPSNAAPKVSLDNVVEGDRVTGELELCATVQTNKFVRVQFYLKEGDKAKRLIGQDLSPMQFRQGDLTACEEGALVFRYLFDTAQVPSDTPVEFTVELDDYAGNVTTDSAKVVIDHRSAKVLLHYENGHRRASYFTIAHGGMVTMPQRMNGRDAVLMWPHGVREMSVFFETPDDAGFSFDKPVRLSYNQHVLPVLKTDAKGVPSAELFVNDARKVGSKNNYAEDGDAKPEVLIAASKSNEPPLGDTNLFVRGGMNAWGTKHPMKFWTNNAYVGEVELPAGKVDFKFADDAWSEQANFGGPFGRGGLIEGGSAGNLRFIVPEGGTDKYQFMFFYNEDAAGKTYAFYRIAPLKAGRSTLKKAIAAKNEARRPLTFVVHFENGNNRTELFGNDQEGRPIWPQPLVKNQFTLEWSERAQGLWFFLSTPTAQGYKIDGPIEISLMRDFKQFRGARDKLSLYVNDAYDVSLSNNYKLDGGRKPEPLVDTSQHAPDIFDGNDIFVRGTMNGWGLGSPMKYSGSSMYTTKIRMLPGTHQFKFGNDTWSSGMNLGASYGPDGLGHGGMAGNITVLVPPDGKGIYRVDLFTVPGYKFYRIGKQ